VQQRDGEGDGLFGLVVALLDDVVLTAQDQLTADVFSEAHERHAQHACLDFLIFE